MGPRRRQHVQAVVVRGAHAGRAGVSGRQLPPSSSSAACLPYCSDRSDSFASLMDNAHQESNLAWFQVQWFACDRFSIHVKLWQRL